MSISIHFFCVRDNNNFNKSKHRGDSMQAKVKDRNIRNWIQWGIFVLILVIGLQFYLFVLQASGDGPITIARPAGVEGFLPIGALMGWKRFVLTGHWDMIHPAAMIILGFAALISWLFHKAFCSWINIKAPTACQRFSDSVTREWTSVIMIF